MLELVKPGTGYGPQWLARKLAPGVEWLRATVTVGNQVGTRALRVLPNSGIQAGPNASVERGEETYGHRVGVNLAYSTAARMAATPPDYTQGSWISTDLTGLGTGHMAADSFVALRAAPIISTDANGSPVLGTELALSDTTTDDINRWLNGAIKMDLPAGRYLLEYTWTFSDGRYMRDRKILQVRGQPTGEKNACIYPGGVETKANGTIASPVAVKKGDILKYEIVVNNPGPDYPLTVPNPVFMDPLDPNADAPTPINFINGSFEEPDVTKVGMTGAENPWQPGVAGINGNGAYYDTQTPGRVPGWFSVPASTANIGATLWSCIQFFQHNNTALEGYWPYPSGNQMAELNAHYPSRVYQICQTMPGSKIYWELSHCAWQTHTGALLDVPVYLYPPGTTAADPTQSMYVYLYKTWNAALPGSDPVNYALPPAGSRQIPRGQAAPELITYVSERWKKYRGVYTVPAGQTSTTLAFEANYGYMNSNTSGNYLDDIRVFTNSFLTMQLTHDAPGNKADIGQTVTYSLEITNIGAPGCNTPS